MTCFNVNISFKGYWCVGTGKEAGAYADALVIKDKDGLPYVPGTTFKGILRDAFEYAAVNGWLGTPNDAKRLLDYIFGKEGTNFKNVDYSNLKGADDEITAQGVLSFTNIELSEERKQFFRAYPNYKDCLYKIVHNVALENHVAKRSSLRAVEVCVPMDLVGALHIDTKKLTEEFPILTEEDFLDLLNAVMAFISEIGGKRRRGMGSCVVSAKVKENRR